MGHLKRGRSDFVPISVGEDLGGAAISPGLSRAGFSWRDDHLFPRYSDGGPSEKKTFLPQ